ncbi:hypothetical protein N752_10790 [Desulforamulus aquiferis]|nr:hypothetical protein N752_10790 [Desulforamulus aquiferis]
MKENSFLWVALYYLRSRKEAICLGFVFHIIFVVIFYLYSLEFEALAYAFLLSACIATVFMVYDFIKYYKNIANYAILPNISEQIYKGCLQLAI